MSSSSSSCQSIKSSDADRNRNGKTETSTTVSLSRATSRRLKPAPVVRAEPPFALFDDSKCGPSQQIQPTFAQGLSAVANLLAGRKNIVVITGAGISVSSGIPDFRSKHVGLYETLDTEALGLSCPEDLFDLSFFQDDPRPFYQFARRLYFPVGSRKERVRPSDAHRLLALLDQKHLLLRVYSQNIDGLEQDAGVASQRIVYAHGSLQWATCQQCHQKVGLAEMEDDIWNGMVARCRNVRKQQIRNGRSMTADKSKNSAGLDSVQQQRNGVRTSSRKRTRQGEATTTTTTTAATMMRTRGTTRKESLCGGVLKPDVTFFGEALGDNVRRCLEADRGKVDALIVIGTSLSVAPISKAIRYFPSNIPRILINRTIVHPAKPTVEEDDNDDSDDSEGTIKNFRDNYEFDAYLLGYSDDVTRALAKELFPTSSPSSDESSVASSSTKQQVPAGQLLATLLNENGRAGDKNFVGEGQDWSTIQVPHDRVFLFPGAQNSVHDTESDDIVYHEVATCDACSKTIKGMIRKCNSCFDFDLCSECYPLVSKKHFDGKHRFSTEVAAASPSTS